MFVQAAVMWIFMWRNPESLFNRTFRIVRFRIHYDTSLNLVYSLMSILVMWSNTIKQYFKSLVNISIILTHSAFPPGVFVLPFNQLLERPKQMKSAFTLIKKQTTNRKSWSIVRFSLHLKYFCLNLFFHQNLYFRLSYSRKKLSWHCFFWPRNKFN